MTPVGRFHIWSISWCPVSTFGIKLTYWILKIRKQILRLHRLLPIASPLGSGEKRGMGSFEPGSHREPLLGQTDLPSTRAWVQAGKMLSASRLNVFGKPERWKKQLRAADSRECSKNVFCTLGMQSHHPETLNYQLQTKRRDVKSSRFFTRCCKPSPKRIRSSMGPVEKMLSSRGRQPGPPILAPSPTSIYLTWELSLSLSLAFFFWTTLITTWYSIYWLSPLFPVCVCLEYKRCEGWNFILFTAVSPSTQNSVWHSRVLLNVCSKLLV